MAETTTPRLGLSVYSSGNDLHPDREKFNAQQRLLDAILATAQQGTLAERPAAGIGGSLYWATDNSRLYYDDGAAWRDVNTTGGGGSGAPISVGGTAAEGTSARAARADHTHVLPLATSTAPGALSAADKKKLDAATPSATPNTLMMTDANGRSQTATPVNDADAVNKAYVDQTAANASNLTNGTVPLGRLPVVTSAANGIMLAADKAKLDAASMTTENNTLVQRTAAGNIYGNAMFIDGAQSNYANAATRKDYVDAQVATRAASSHSHDVATASAAGYMSATDKAKLDGATAAATANTLVMNDAYGRFSVTTPTLAAHAANKGYVDAQVGTRAASSHKHEVADLNPGTLTMTRLRLTSTNDASETSTAHAFQIGDDSTYNIIIDNNEVIGRNNGALSSIGFPGGLTVPAPASVSSATRKDYVDGQIATRAPASHSHADATASAAGFLSAADKAKLDGATASATANTLVMNDAYGRFSVVTPTAASHAANKGYVDGKTWDGSDITSGTINQARIANATASLNGLMSSTDKAKLDAAAYAPTSNAIPMVNSTGNFKVPYAYVEEANPQSTLAHSLTRKDYVDGKLADIFVGTEIPDSANLNNYTTPGIYHNSTNASVVTGSNYPSTMAGKLEVTKSASGSMVYQLWTDFNSTARIYYRSKYGSSWYAWKELVNDQSVSMLAYAAATGPGALSDFDAYTTPGVYLNAGSSTVQDFLLEVFSQPGGNLMQRKTTTVGSYKVMVRFKRGSTWTAWSVL